MMKIMIVDDDFSVHQNIKIILNRNGLKFSILKEAYSGKEGLKLLEKETPDIIITDMRMPVMDGLTFMERINKMEISCKLIVLSGYADFNYARNSFRFGAVDYLLKPINEVDLLQALEKAEAAIQQENQDNYIENTHLYKGLTMIQEEFLSDMTINFGMDENEIIVKSEQLKIDLSVNYFFVASIKLQNTEESLNKKFKNDLNQFYTYVKSLIAQTIGMDFGILFRQVYEVNEFVLIYESKYKEIINANYKNIYEKFNDELNIKLFIGVSKEFEYLDDICKAYRQANDALDHTLLNSTEYIAEYGEQHFEKDKTWEDIIRRLECLSLTKNLSSIRELVELIEDALSEESIQRIMIGNLVLYITEVMKKTEELLPFSYLKEEEKSDLRVILNLIQKYAKQRNITRACNTFKMNLHKVSLFYQSINYQLFDEVEKYISEHFKTVTLSDIASYFHLNKNYFSTLFKNIVGKNFSEYLECVRVKKAAYLLEHTSMKIYEIADSVGYTDSRYFSQVFRKINGLTPSDYREKILNLF